MNRFIQLHLLTSYPPSNLNRDDLGRPKTAMMGGELRLRVSSQSLKRAWRTSDFFETKDLKSHKGIRTKEMGLEIFKKLKDKEVDEKQAKEWVKLIMEQFGKLNTLSQKEIEKLKNNKVSEKEKDKLNKKALEHSQLVHFSLEEKQAIDELCSVLAKRKSEPTKDELKNLLQKNHKSVDIAMFGRMLASAPEYNTEAAVQVAHAISVHSVVVEDDFWTAVDDLNKGEEDMGSAHLGEIEFSAGLFYLYICIDTKSLLKNLSNDKELANKALKALIESVSQIAPTGKQNSFASRSRASYIRCEAGHQQPRSLSVAFLKPVEKGDMLKLAVEKLKSTAKKMNTVYGTCYETECVMNAETGEGSLQDIMKCATQ